MAFDLAVLSQDPRFGGGGWALTESFLAAARALKREPTVLYDAHPGLGDGGITWRRIEALRQLSAAKRFEADARSARSLWVAASLAQHGAAAPRAGRPYGCWAATTIAAEWRGRAPGLSRAHRLAAAASIPVLKRLERAVLDDAAALYATSPASREDIAAAAGRDVRDVGLLPIPVDANRFAPAGDDEWRDALSKPVLVFVGRARDPRKNIGLLLEAFAQLRTTHPAAQLRLVGQPPSGSLPPGVEAAGEVSDIAALLRGGAVFVLPSRQEGFGIVAAEALAAGLPVVSTPSGGPEELLRASGGGIVTGSFDAAALSDAIRTLTDDPDATALMRAAGRDYVNREHSPARFQELVAAALRQVDGD